MKRILTTHVGSLPRSEKLLSLLQVKNYENTSDKIELEKELANAVNNIVAKQVEVGIDFVSDGELSKPSYATYITDRLTGFSGEWKGHVAQDLRDYREFAKHLVEIGEVVPRASGACCQSEISPRDMDQLNRDIDNFRKAIINNKPNGQFLNAASPGVIAVFQKNEYYKNETAYIEAIANAMRPEYEAIVNAGFSLQLDCPDLAMGRHLAFADITDNDFLKIVKRNIDALNEATKTIDPEKMRMHLCWGNYPGPHHHDIPLKKILSEILRAKPKYLLLEGANPRHAHEYECFHDTKLPEDKVLVPGVIDSTSNYIEHPDLVAQRICNYANIVGRDRVMAGSDCGFATISEYPTVYPALAWEKMKSLVEGARIASKKLW
ncbi:MAG: cobalamin-independent methionine synthase II family protein [Pseudomonadota bacterium]|nr:cobalamin-independent methionine synthase II family protein [Pseudomonadota bacterium]